MKRNALHHGSIAVVVASLLWSVDGLLRTSLYSLPPVVIVAWEHALGFVVLLPFLVMARKSFKKLSRPQWLAIALVALLSGTAGTIFYTAALGQVYYIPFSVVVVLQQLNPVFAIATAAILLKEKPSRTFFILTAVALVGAYLVSFPNLSINYTTGSGTVIAALYAVAAAASWGIGTAFSKYALKDTSYVQISAARFGLTALFALMLVPLLGAGPALQTVNPTQWYSLLAITCSTGLVALVIYYYGLQKIKASHAATLELVWPLSSVVVGWVFLHQTLSATQLVGALILLISTYVIGRSATDQTNKKHEWR